MTGSLRYIRSIVDQWISLFSDPSQRESASHLAARTLLERRLHSNPSLITLHKLTIMLPLAGVVLTAASFALMSQAQSAPQSPTLPTTTPDLLAGQGQLFYGVVFGAFMAIVNHGFTIRVARRSLSQLRRAEDACDKWKWYDRSPTREVDEFVRVLSKVINEYDRRAGDAGDSLARVVDAMRESSQSIANASQQIDAATLSLQAAGEHWKDHAATAAERLNATLERLTTKLSDSCASMTASSAGTVDGLHGVREAADVMREAVDSLNEVARRTSEGSTRLEHAIGDLKRASTEAAANVAGGLTTTIEKLSLDASKIEVTMVAASKAARRAIPDLTGAANATSELTRRTVEFEDRMRGVVKPTLGSVLKNTFGKS
jgi:methyl-accepting chemotaxis protein